MKKKKTRSVQYALRWRLVGNRWQLVGNRWRLVGNRWWLVGNRWGQHADIKQTKKRKPKTVLGVTCRHKKDQKSEAKKSAHTRN